MGRPASCYLVSLPSHPGGEQFYLVPGQWIVTLPTGNCLECQPWFYCTCLLHPMFSSSLSTNLQADNQTPPDRAKNSPPLLHLVHLAWDA